MKKSNSLYKVLSFFKYILILWIPILLVEETFIFNYIDIVGTMICSLLMGILCLVMYIKTYNKIKKDLKNCYIYNISNAIILAIINMPLGDLFIRLIDLNIFHQCNETGWDCFLFGVEYILVGFEYASLSIITLITWLIIKSIKILSIKRKNCKHK